MTNNELEAWKSSQRKNMILAIVSGVTTLGLFYMSESWTAAIGMIPLLWISSLSAKN